MLANHQDYRWHDAQVPPLSPETPLKNAQRKDRPWLLPHANVPPEDGRILPFLGSLARPTIVHSVLKAAVANDERQLYRVVLLYNLLELLELTAKLNALGYQLDPELKHASGWHYGAVFSRMRCTRIRDPVLYRPGANSSQT